MPLLASSIGNSPHLLNYFVAEPSRFVEFIITGVKPPLGKKRNSHKWLFSRSHATSASTLFTHLGLLPKQGTKHAAENSLLSHSKKIL